MSTEEQENIVDIDDLDALQCAQELITETVVIEGKRFTIRQIAVGDLNSFLFRVTKTLEGERKKEEEDPNYISEYNPGLVLVSKSLCSKNGNPLFDTEEDAVAFLKKCQPRLMRKLIDAVTKLNPYTDADIEAEAKN